MKNKFLIVLSLFIIIITSVLTVTVFGAETKYSFNVSMTANNSKVKAGDEVLITVKVSNLEVGENGINSFSAYLSYDNDVFEQPTESNIDGIDGWKPNYTVGTTKIQLYRERFLKTDGEIMQISLKTKEGLQNGTQGEVKLSTIIVSNSVDETTNPKPISTTITIGNDDSPVVSLPDSPSNNTIKIGNSVSINPQSNTISNSTIPVNNSITPINSIITPTNNITPANNVTPANNTVNEVPVTNDSKNIVENEVDNGIQVINETESDSDIPYTGTDGDALIRIIIGVIFISLVIYIKIERMNKDIK